VAQLQSILEQVDAAGFALNDDVVTDVSAFCGAWSNAQASFTSTVFLGFFAVLCQVRCWVGTCSWIIYVYMYRASCWGSSRRSTTATPVRPKQEMA
jgi:hypothetical protein